MKSIKFFEANLGEELNRCTSTGEFIQTVTCTEENIMNLYNSQFSEFTVYGQVFSYNRVNMAVKLFIELSIQDGERKYTHRVLHTTNGKNIKFAAERYAATHMGVGVHYNGEDFWWVDGVITVRVEKVIELTDFDYEIMYKLFYSLN